MHTSGICTIYLQKYNFLSHKTTGVVDVFILMSLFVEFDRIVIIQIKTCKYWLYKLIFPLIPLGQNWIYLTQGCLHISYSFSGGFFSKINMCCYISLWSHSTAEDRDLKKLKPTIPDNASILNPPFLSTFFENKIVKENNTFLKTSHYLLLKLYLIVHSTKSDYPSPKMRYVK